MEEIAGPVDAFCKQHLNEEYADLCRRLTEKLGRKRPSPLVSGLPKNPGLKRDIREEALRQGLIPYISERPKPFE